jgi:hypothetical protein
MNSSAAKILPALDRAEEHLEVIITVRSIKYDCHVAYMLNKHEIENGYTEAVIRDMSYRLMDFIGEKLNAASEGKESKDEKGLLN